MILSQPDLRAAVARGDLKFEPALEERQWGEASVDLRLGLKFTKLKAKEHARFSLAGGMGVLDSSMWVEKVLREKDEFDKPETFTIGPGDFVLALTHEHIWVPPDMIGHVEGRSSYARVGLSMHQTAPWLQPGWHGHITLEIRNSGPLYIDLKPIAEMPCQVVFFPLSKPLDPTQAYGSRSGDVFQNQTTALPSQKGR